MTTLPDLYRTASRASLADLGRVVMIGEASHGSADFSRERARIAERLIEKHGFTVVAVEADWPDADRANRFVMGNSDDVTVAEALDDFHRFPTWMWRNTEVVRFIGWLRDHNDSVRDPRRKVRFRVVGARGELDVGQLARQRYGNHAVADRADHLRRRGHRSDRLG